MVKTSQLVGLPVVTTGEGSIYGRVRDVSLAVNRKSVWGIMVERNNLMRTSRWIPYEGILLVGDVSILIKEGQRGVKQIPPDAVVLPKKARTLGGEDAGMVQDIWMDEKTGRVEALLLSSSLWDDLRRGRTAVKQYAHLDDEQDIVVLPEERDEEDE